MPRIWTEEQKAAAAETRRRTKEARMEQLPDSERDIVEFGDKKAIEMAQVGPVGRPTIVQVTYRPLDGDPHTTVWHGIKFEANVPVELDRNNRAHHIEQLLPKSIVGTNGESLTKHVPSTMFMGDLARGNPSFDVDGERAKRLVNKRVLPMAGHGWAEDHVDEIVEWR